MKRVSAPQHSVLAEERFGCEKKDAVSCFSAVKNGSTTSPSNLLRVSLGAWRRAVSEAQQRSPRSGPPCPTSNARGCSETSVLVSNAHSAISKHGSSRHPGQNTHPPRHRERQRQNSTNPTFQAEDVTSEHSHDCSGKGELSGAPQGLSVARYCLCTQPVRRAVLITGSISTSWENINICPS